jgi:hypothetical protein
MSLLLSTTLFASLATAQLTTSIWLPGAANANQSFVGSVVTQEGDRTTLAVAVADSVETEYLGTVPGQVTVAGTTYVGYKETSSGSDAQITLDFACSRKDGTAVPTCVINTLSWPPADSDCASQSGGFTTTYTVTDTPFGNGDGEPVTRTVTETEANACTGIVGASDFPQSTVIMSGDMQYFMNNYQLVITAGTEKLGASAAATPSGSSAQSTSGSGASTGNHTATSSKPLQATGAAGPMITVAPILAGLGAAAAFFV